jgi:hypothetical protein
MPVRLIALFLLSSPILAPLLAQDDRTLNESLRELHDRGADLYNGGDQAGAYRLFEGGLSIAKSMLGHRPNLQRTISEGMKEADALASIGKKAFRLHELIETVRTELRGPAKPKGPEVIAIPPREVAGPPPAKIAEIQDGIVGRVFWKGQPVGDVDVVFVSLGKLEHRVYETATGEQGGYAIPKVPAGQYIVVLRPTPKSTAKLPERYATTTTSPLKFDVKGGGEKIDLMLQ